MMPTRIRWCGKWFTVNDCGDVVREESMEKFEGTGAECYKMYADNNKKGRINLTEIGSMILIPKWLAQPCTYTPPEPQWVDCTAGEALDLGRSGGKFQVWEHGVEKWVDSARILLSLWHWTDPQNKYRKEV